MLALVLVAAGLGVAAVGITQQRLTAAAQPDAVDVALGLVELPDEAGPSGSVVYRTIEPVLDAGSRLLRRLSPTRRIALVRRRIVLANLEGQVTVERVFAYKALAAAVFFVVGFGLPSLGQLPVLVTALLVGFAASFAPDVVLAGRADSRQQQIARALPEALDLLALTVEAGLGLEQGIEVVVENSTGPLAGELSRLLREVEIGVPRRDALVALRERTDVVELSSFVVALVQSESMGISLGDVLKTQAAQVRLKRRQRAREKAAKTPVKILFPLIIGIFPALFVVTIGPGAIKIAQSF